MALSARELDIEYHARTVACPICKARPGKPCKAVVGKSPKPQIVAVAHLGRLKTARGEPL